MPAKCDTTLAINFIREGVLMNHTASAGLWSIQFWVDIVKHLKKAKFHMHSRNFDFEQPEQLLKDLLLIKEVKYTI